MKALFYRFLSVGACALLLFGCKPDIEAPSVEKGSLDVSKYVAVGNSITAGYADNALYYEGQQVSYANLLADQFKQIGGGEFRQPLVSPSSVGVGSTGGPRLLLSYKTDCLGASSLSPVPSATAGDLSIFATPIYASQGPFQNMGVPGAKAIATVYPGYGNPANGAGKYNPFFFRMASAPASSSILQDAASQNPTFFTLFIGSNDVLLYALSGAAQDSITPTEGTPGVGFNASIDLIVATLTAKGAKGAVANIPDITSLPYFTTAPYNGLALSSADQVAALNNAYKPFGITFQLGANPFIIEDANAPGKRRQIQSNEYVLLSIPQDSLKCKQWGSVKPIPNQYVLTNTEINAIKSAVTAYNSKLQSVAASKGLAFVDVNAFLASVEKGITYNGIELSTKFVSGGAFSLDGVHLTPLGNAMLANEFIKSINRTYGATLPLVDASKYSGVKFP